MEDNNKINEKMNKGSTSKFEIRPVLIIGIVTVGAAIFGYFQLAFFNTFVQFVLKEGPFAVALMVSISSITGLLFLLFFGVISDNTRTRFGRRRPYLLFGIIAGFSMIAFAFIQDFLLGLILRASILEIAINAYYAVQRSLTADLVPLEHRGKANGIISNLALIGMIIAVGATVYVNDAYVSHGELNQGGHLILFFIGGISIIICGIAGFILLR